MLVGRPLLRYHGGKFMLAKWIISHFPEHKVYVEPFGGAASVLLLKKRSYAEIYNDLDKDVVNLFKIVRSQGDALVKALHNTPYSREEFELSYERIDDNFEMARRLVVRSFMGFGSSSASGRKSGFRSNSNRSGTTPAHDWINYPESLKAIIDRLRGVVIENRDASEIIKAHDSLSTLIYLDPPYVLSTRHMGESTKEYNFEMSDQQHSDLLSYVKTLKSMVVISGYDNEVYNDCLSGWHKVNKKTFADGAKERTEILYINQNCANNNRQLKAF